MIARRIIVMDTAVSLMERAARAVEPTREELDKIKAPPPYSRVAVKIKAARDIDGLRKVISHQVFGARKPATPGAPLPTNALVKTLDGEDLRFFNDGSLRHAGGRVKGKAARKALKRAHHR